MQNPLGKEIGYPNTLDSSVLFGIARELARKELNANKELIFRGSDLWRCYEFSWLNDKGKPENKILELTIPCLSENIVESKSLKLFLGSFANEKFATQELVADKIKEALVPILKCEDIQLDFINLDSFIPETHILKNDESLDGLDLEIDCYQVNPSLLKVGDNQVAKKVYTDLFRALCPVTGQPDWATIVIEYKGAEIKAEGLLKYLISFRNHQGFHEEACERIFVDLIQHCTPKELTVSCYFTRRGGIDISPMRTTLENKENHPKFRAIRQ
jgi:7-cyano-7-deazaguanine reductase